MKLLLSVLLMSATLAEASMKNVIAIRPGVYESKHEIALMYANTEKKCKDNGGVLEGSGEDALCIVKDVADTIKISVAKTPTNKIMVEISTIGTNLHTCEFQAEAVALPNGRLLAQEETEVLGEDGKYKVDFCEVLIDQNQNGLMSIVREEKRDACRNFCGMNMSLDIEGATKSLAQ